MLRIMMNYLRAVYSFFVSRHATIAASPNLPLLVFLSFTFPTSASLLELLHARTPYL